ncbi:MAG: Crp/Fnr family transcriptional regulator [Phycisphaerae bacterium]
MPDVADILSRSIIFKDIRQDDIEDLCLRGKTQSYESGDRLFDRGEKAGGRHPLRCRGEDATKLMILQDGVVELVFPIQIMGVTRDLIMETKRSGDVVAWSALVGPYRFTLAARCASDCLVTCLDRALLESFFNEHPRRGYLFMRNLAGVIGQRLHAMQTIWLHDLQSNAIKRLG